MTPWRADLHSQYWFVGSDLNIYPEVDTRDEIDNNRYEAGNYFSTRTEAIRAAHWIRAGLQCMRGETMDKTIERLIEARSVFERVHKEK